VTSEPSVQERYSLGAVLAFSRETGRQLDGLIEPDHFAAG
jgi:hypothetical protein